MKLLAFSIPGNKIQPPDQVVPIMNALRPFGGNLLSNFIELLLLIAVLTTLAYSIYGGFLWLNSGGDKKKVETAKHTVVGAILGLILVALAFLIVNVFGAFLQVPLLNNTLGG